MSMQRKDDAGLCEESGSDEVGGDIVVRSEDYDLSSDSDDAWGDEGVSRVQRNREFGGVSSKVSLIEFYECKISCYF